MEEANTILQKVFGYSGFRNRQAEIIETLVAGGDAFVLMPTGGGKSLCYQIPALLRDGVAVVVSPLIALMQDQVDALRQLGIKAAFLNSSLNYPDRLAVERKLAAGQLDLLYVAPERLVTDDMLQRLGGCRIALFAIDEAHCVSQWGHDFRPEYRQLSVLPKHFPGVPRIALTATADARTRGEIIQQLALQRAAVYINSFDRPNIRYIIRETQNPREKLWRFIQKEHPEDAGIVYCLSRKKVDATAEWLNQRGRRALPYHAGMTAQQRTAHQQRFLREDGLIIVATIAFGMGIDKPDVRFVAHLSLPKNIESYSQETGRAGRDGAPASAWMNYGLQDVILLRQMLQESDAGEDYKRVTQQKLEAMLGLCESVKCRRHAILDYFGEKSAEICGNCDNCLAPPATWDATVDAQKALSCIYRTGQRYGTNYVIDLLLGKADPRVTRNHHDQLQVYGLGAHLAQSEWRSLLRQLIAQGYIEADMERYGALKLLQKARSLLRGESELLARRQVLKGDAETKPKQKTMPLRLADEALFEALKALRRKLAEEQGVPPYVIFHDTSLSEMARQRPRGDDAFCRITGVGDTKLKRYGESFMQVIAAHPLPAPLQNGLPDTVNETLYLHAQGKDVETIAKVRALTTGTVYAHLADAVAAGVITVAQAVPELSASDIQAIEQAAFSLNYKESRSLKPIYEQFDEQWDYGILRCVLAQL